MKKKSLTDLPGREGRKQLWRIMRLTFLFSFCFAMLVSANSYSQATKLSLKLTGTTIKEVLNEVENKSEFIFLYKNGEMNDQLKVNIDVRNATINQILDKILNGQGLSYDVYNRQVIIRKNPGGNDEFSSIMQSVSISGKVSDTSEASLPGVSVVVKGTTNGTITDSNGNYTLSNIPANAILQFSFVGMKSQEIAVGKNKTINVVLEEETVGIEEVVAIGYGTQRKKDLTGSVASISNKEIKNLPITSVEGAMQGRMPGVMIQQSSGQPGAGIVMRIRGASSIAGGNDPLFVIDGVPQFNSNSSSNSTNGLAALNPNDVESIEILKDASATAIYGSRAANGVVMVTTKRGKSGEPTITYSGYSGMTQVRKKLDLMSGDEYISYVKKVLTNSGAAIPGELETVPHTNTDYQDLVFRNAIQQSHSLSLSGGSDKTTYYSSIDYLGMDGVVKNSSYKRGSFRLNLNTELNDRVSLQTYFFGSKGTMNGFSPADGSNTQFLGKSGVGSILLATPSAPVYKADGSYASPRLYSFSGIDMENPINYIKSALDETNTTKVQGVFDLKVKLIKGMNYTARVGAVTENRRRDVYLPTTLIAVTSGKGIGNMTQFDSFDALTEHFLDYTFNPIRNLKVDALAGVSYQSQKYKSIYLWGSGYLSDNLKNYNFSAAASVSKPVTDIITNTIASAFGRVNLNYQEKYLLTATLRGDGASVFSKNKKYGYFPSLAFAWKVSEEGFVKDNLPSVTVMKLRASWGLTGNPAIAPYQSLSIANTVNTSQGGGTTLVVGLSPSLPNDNLSWETTEQTNVGIDLGFFKNRLRSSIDWYNKETRDLLATVSLPPSSGYSSIIDNVGKVRNRGMEFTLGATIIDNDDLKWDFDANLSANRNKVLQTKNNTDMLTSYSSIVRVGEPLGSFYTLKFTGFDAKGKQTWLDVNKDGAIDAKDNVVVGGAQPKFIYGFNTSLSYKRWTFAAVIQGVSGVKVNNLFLVDLTSNGYAYNHIANADKFMPNPSTKDADRMSDLYIEDASYIRLKNVRLNYNFPMKRKTFIQGLNVYVSGANLITITNYSGYDPEVNSFGGSNSSQGVDYAAYPGTKTYTIGINAKF